jgi:hypothetical protein
MHVKLPTVRFLAGELIPLRFTSASQVEPTFLNEQWSPSCIQQ